MQVGDLVQRKGWGAYQELYNKEPHFGIVVDTTPNGRVVDVFWFKDDKKILTNKDCVELVSKCK
jgi:hypothetical protein